MKSVLLALLSGFVDEVDEFIVELEFWKIKGFGRKLVEEKFAGVEGIAWRELGGESKSFVFEGCVELENPDKFLGESKLFWKEERGFGVEKLNVGLEEALLDEK